MASNLCLGLFLLSTLIQAQMITPEFLLMSQKLRVIFRRFHDQINNVRRDSSRSTVDSGFISLLVSNCPGGSGAEEGLVMAQTRALPGKQRHHVSPLRARGRNWPLPGETCFPSLQKGCSSLIILFHF